MGRASRKGPGPFTYLLLPAFDGLQDLVLAVELDLGVADAVHDVLRRAGALGVGGHSLLRGEAQGVKNSQVQLSQQRDVRVVFRERDPIARGRPGGSPVCIK